MKIEIKNPLFISTKEKTWIDMHSFLNIFNVIFGELQCLQMNFEDETGLSKSFQLCHDTLASLNDQEGIRNTIKNLDSNKNIITDEVEKVLSQKGFSSEVGHEIEESLENIKNIFSVLETRIHELLSRKNDDEWVTSHIEDLKHNIIQLLDAIAKNSHGRFSIVYRSPNQHDNVYFVTLEIQSINRDKIMIPAVLLDSFRDVIANALKYTAPGGKITARLIEKNDVIELSVADTGRGIPEDEIEQVVNFGVRGSNTQENETKGGGFGLTKAYYICQKFGGKMWIDSTVDVGTKIAIIIPSKKLNLYAR